MTLFDLIAGAILLISALVGYSRGAVRELVTVCAFGLATMAALFLLPLSGPIGRHTFHPSWVGNTAAIVVVFLIAYVGFRWLGGWVASYLHKQAALSVIDRSIGLAFGVVRALIFLGLFYIVFSAATPPELVPGWISRGALFPLARASGEALGTFAPTGFKAASRLGAPLEDAVKDGVTTTPDETVAPRPKPARHRPKAAAYGDSARDALDTVVERTR